jgi:uncharacterized protein
MTHVEHLTVDRCLSLLERHRVGRLAVVDADGPLILPVNYLLDRGTVVLRSDPGLKVDLANDHAEAAFEIDGVDHTRRLGWSVLVRGRLSQVTDPDEVARLHALELAPYVGGDKAHLLQLDSRSITGRRILVPPEVPSDRMAAVALGNVWLGRDGDDLLA